MSDSQDRSISAEWRAEAIRLCSDPLSGAVVEQLTSDAVTSTNVYPERRFAAADGSRIVISRHPFSAANELWVVDLRSLQLTRVDAGRVVDGNAPRNAIYYVDQRARLMRFDLLTLATREMFEFDDASLGRCVVSPDERYAVTGPHAVKDNVYALHRRDLRSGTSEVLCEMEDIFNPHLQFDPAGGYRLLMQVSRGDRPAREGQRKHRGTLGKTLCVLDGLSGQVTPLPVGPPHTPRITGHQCWVGQTGRIIFTAGHYDVSASSHVTPRPQRAPAERGVPPVAVYIVAPGDPAPTVLASDRMFNHLAASDDGHYFIGDHHPTGRIYVGSIATGTSVALCDSHTRQGACQYSHVHAYMTPDNRHVIFNSIVTGVAQVYAACVPEGFLENVRRQTTGTMQSRVVV